MSSDTSSDIDINILDNHGNNMNIPSFKKETSETDLYLNLIANPTKSRQASENSTSSLRFGNNDKDNDTSSVRRMSHHSTRDSSKKHHRSDTKSDRKHKKSYDSHRSTDSSHARYEDVKLSNNNSSELSEKPAPKLTGQQLRMKKIDLLRKLSDIKSKGYKLTKEYDFNSSIEEMEYEYDLLKSFADRRNGLKLYKNTIINVTNLVEFFNDKYDPFGIQLSGWSEHMSVEVDSYDDVLEELYEKYKGAGKSMPPEIKLVILIGFSASAFHFSKKHMSNLPGEGTGSTPLGSLQTGIAQKIASMGKEKSKFMSEQELSIERQRDEMREKDKMMKEMMRKNMMQNNTQPPQSQSNLTNARAPVNFNAPAPAQSSFNPGGPPSLLIQNKDPRPVIKSTESVRDVLSRLHNRETDTIDTQDESTVNDRLLSDTTASESKKKARKKPLMTIQ
jgi:hypothetical protein